MKKILYSTALLFLVSFISACQHPVVKPQFATMINNNIVIRSTDGKWSFTMGKTFKPPVTFESGKLSVSYINKNLSAYNLERYQDAMIDVFVIVNGKEKLYGKMLFSNVFENAGSNSAKRKWTVGISNTYLNVARQGNVAVVYQPYRYNKREWASWALWMSSLPLN